MRNVNVNAVAVERDRSWAGNMDRLSAGLEKK